jgi:hypothetical protein
MAETGIVRGIRCVPFAPFHSAVFDGSCEYYQFK